MITAYIVYGSTIVLSFGAYIAWDYVQELRGNQ